MRLLVLPNYGFYLDHKLEPEYVFAERRMSVTGKDKKISKKDKKGKAKKDKKKGKK